LESVGVANVADDVVLQTRCGDDVGQALAKRVLRR
jgi:hypothetical protein